MKAVKVCAYFLALCGRHVEVVPSMPWGVRLVPLLFTQFSQTILHDE